MKIQQIYFVPPQNVTKIFRTHPAPLGHNYCNPPTMHCGTGPLISVPNDLQRRWTTVCVSATQLCVLHLNMHALMLSKH